MTSELHDHDRGLAFDLSTLMRRRSLLGLFGAVGVTALAGCSENAPTAAPTGATGMPTPGASATAGECLQIPSETAGPFPGDGSNGPNVLTQSGIVRGDIRAGFGTASGVAQGVPLTINLTVVDTANGCAPLAGAAVYLWHCDREGRYSLYSAGATDQNYLRGVQVADASGKLSFTSIFPAAYSGRWPHAHFEVYPNLQAATSAGSKLITSQLALPQDICDAVYVMDGYGSSRTNMQRTTLQNDTVFRDGVTQQMATISGDASSTVVASLVVPV